MRHPPHHIFEHTPDSLREWCTARKMPPFRAAQVLDWVYRKQVTDPALMSNLSALDRQTLARDMTFLSGEVIKHQSASDGVQKLLVEWTDFGTSEPEAPATGSLASERAEPVGPTRDSPTGLASRLRIAGQPVLGVVEKPGGDTARQTESVMIPSEDPSGPRRTACISSQVGCPVGCRFCASGLGGLDGNLSAGRIVEQVYRLGTLPGVERVTNVVFRGMGEPLSNFSAVTSAIRTINALWGLAI